RPGVDRRSAHLRRRARRARARRARHARAVVALETQASRPPVDAAGAGGGVRIAPGRRSSGAALALESPAARGQRARLAPAPAAEVRGAASSRAAVLAGTA